MVVPDAGCRVEFGDVYGRLVTGFGVEGGLLL
jgi:hypothetical protein